MRAGLRPSGSRFRLWQVPPGGGVAVIRGRKGLALHPTHPPPPVILPARQIASALALPAHSRRASPFGLARPPAAKTPQVSASLGEFRTPAPSPIQQSGAREKIRLWAGAGVEACQCSGGASRCIGATNRGAACVALRPPLSGDICRPPRPGKRPQANFFSDPGLAHS